MKLRLTKHTFRKCIVKCNLLREICVNHSGIAPTQPISCIEMCHWDSELRWGYCNKSTFLAFLHMCFQIYVYSFLLKTSGYIILVMKVYLADTGRKQKQVSVIFSCPWRWEELFWCTAKHCISTVWHILRPLFLHNQIWEIHDIDNVTTFLLSYFEISITYFQVQKRSLVLCLILRLWCKEDKYFYPLIIISSLCIYLLCYPFWIVYQKKKPKPKHWMLIKFF